MEAISAVQLWSGRLLSGLAVLFLFVDAIGKLLRIGPVVEGTVKLGYPETVVFPLGMLRWLEWCFMQCHGLRF
jgi:hypothetical protein